MLFIKNKYTNWYNSIITNAQQHNRTKLKKSHPDYVRYEKHHIIPKSLGGNNDTTNLVHLTLREHFVCHWLLTKMLSGKEKQKMLCALRFLNGNYRKSSRIYEYIKTNTTSKGPRSAEHCANISAAKKGKPSPLKGKSSPNKGRKYSHSSQHGLNISLAKTGKKRKPFSEETIQKMRKPKSEAHKKAIADGRRAKYAALRII